MDTDGILGLMQETAEKVITPRFRALEEKDISHKSGPWDLVTVADKEAETYLTKRLQAAFPDAFVVGEECVGGDADQEHLHRHEDDHVDDDRRGAALPARRVSGDAHDSTAPSAQIMPSSRTSTSILPSGRVGGPEMTAPLSGSKFPSWHGQCQRSFSGWK